MLRTGEIYQILRDEIIQGKLNPGERLIENDLCERLGSTRGYIREALKLLRADGFVILNHGKGATVAKVSYQETRDLYELLAILESKSTEFATPHMEFADIQELIKTNHTMESCIHIEDRAAARKVWQEANLRFHRTIAEKCGNKEMELLVENIRWRTFDFRYVYFFETHFTFFCHQHDDLIEAIQEKDAQKARRLMEDHVNKASELALLNLKPAPSLQQISRTGSLGGDDRSPTLHGSLVHSLRKAGRMLEIVLQLIINGLLLGGIYALLSIGLTMIFGVLEIINFAHGEFLMISMYVTFFIFQALGIDPYITLVIIIPLFFFLGVIVERILIQPILNDPPLNQIFTTIGLGLILQNLALLFFKADFRTVKTSYSSANIFLGDLIVSVPRLIAFLVAVSIIAGLFVFLRKTFTGRAIRALAQQRRAAMLMGINVHKTYAIAFGIGIACVGAAGAILMPLFFVFPTVGSLFVLIAFVVVILGGYNSLGGTLVAGLIIGVIEGFSGFFISPHLKEVVYFVMFIFILIFRPTGLFGRRQDRK